jgi:hypothetical protein
MALAVHLTDIEALRERVPLSRIRVPEGLRDWGRIGIGKARRLVGLAREFSRSTRFPSFVEDHQALYRKTGERLRTTIGGEDLVEWLYSFFRPPHQVTHFLVPALLNGNHSYGGRIRLGEDLEFYCFLGVSNWDGSGLPVFGRGQLGTVIHEYAHSYLYPPCCPSLSRMGRVGKRLFLSRREEMRRMGYGRWDSMVSESLARAVTLHYVSTTGSPQAAHEMMGRDEGRGFSWMTGLCQLLQEYQGERGRYPSFSSFFPRIAEFFEALPT